MAEVQFAKACIEEDLLSKSAIKKICSKAKQLKHKELVQGFLEHVKFGEPDVALKVLVILDIIVQNRGQEYGIVVGRFEILNQFIKLVSPKFEPTCTAPVRKKIISLLQAWTSIFPNQTKIKTALDEILKIQEVAQPTPDCRGSLPSTNPVPVKSLDKNEQLLLTPESKERKTESDVWEIDRSDLALMQTLGQGHFGEVKLGHLKTPWGEQIEVAVKFAKGDDANKLAFLKEAENLKKLKHPKLVTCYGVMTTQDPIFIVFEYLAKGSLATYLSSRKKSFPLQRLHGLIQDVLSAMVYLENLHWIHGDLALRNFLVGKDETAILCDFGHAMQTNENHDPIVARHQVPVKWASIETYLYGRCSPKSDVWSFGVVMFEILSKGQSPYHELEISVWQQQVGNFNKWLVALLNAGWRMPSLDKIPEFYNQIMLDCWNKDPKDRPSFKTISEFMCTVQRALLENTNSLFKQRGSIALPKYSPQKEYTLISLEDAKPAAKKLVDSMLRNQKKA
eukprot:m.37340 g.37340  ORF g.37340 m.37340 type:complete len:507 (-) comp9301_c0_seq1:770-2290(-)